MHLHPDMIENAYYRRMLAIEKAEAKYSAKYVGEFPGKTRYGWTADFPIAVFYQANPSEQYPNHYFGLFEKPFEEKMYITNADYVAEQVFTALKFDDGIVYSTHDHDYRKVNGFIIDGGWTHLHGNGGPLISVRVVDGKFEEVENESAGD